MITDNERIANFDDAVNAAIMGNRASVWTAMPGAVVSFDATQQTATVQVGIQLVQTATDGAQSTLNIPLLLDCPVQFPRGGGGVLTFPVAAGDECLVVFASRCIDAWWQQGGIQPQAEFRMHDLSDGFVLLGFTSLPRKLASISSTAVELRSVDGATKISMNPTAGTINLTAPGGVSVTGNLVASGTITGQTDVVAGTVSGKTHRHTSTTAGTPTSTPIP